MKILALFLAAFLFGCDDGSPVDDSTSGRQTPLIYTTTYPLMFLAERLSGEHADVHCAAPAKADLRHWRPQRGQIEVLVGADLLVLHGAGLESWRRSVSLPASRLLNASGALKEHFVVIKGAVTHTHGDKSHTHDGVDPYVWMDLLLMQQQGQAIYDRLLRDPRLAAHKADLEARRKKLNQDLTKELRAQQKVMQPLAGQAVATTESVYAYLGRHHNLKLVDLDLHGASELDAAGLARAQKLVTEHKPRLVLCPGEPAASLRQQLEKLGLRPVVFETAGTLADDRLSKGSDFLTVMAANRERLSKAIEALR